MIWLTWRQFRSQGVAAAVVAAAFAITLAVTGPTLVGNFRSAGLSTCQSNCAADAGRFLGTLSHATVGIFYAAIVIMYLTPALIGIFWGAPLIARELETGTHRIAWNQSVTRTRWAVIKLALVGLAAVATSGLLSLMISWWASPVDAAINTGSSSAAIQVNRLSPVVFAARGIAPLGYAAFAFALGVTIGVLVRKTLPAMAITLVVFVAIQVLVPLFVRPQLLTPDQAFPPLNVNNIGVMMTQQNSMTVYGGYDKPGAWILSDVTIKPDGHVFAGPANPVCFKSDFTACNKWLASLHLRQDVRYQPASRFWPLQWLETAMYLILAAALGLLCAAQVRRRRV